MNSVAKIARPKGIIIIAGTGVKKAIKPSKVILIPIKNTNNLLICL